MYRKCRNFDEYVKQNVGCTPAELSTCSEPMFSADGTPLTKYAQELLDEYNDFGKDMEFLFEDYAPLEHIFDHIFRCSDGYVIVCNGWVNSYELSANLIETDSYYDTVEACLYEIDYLV